MPPDRRAPGGEIKVPMKPFRLPNFLKGIALGQEGSFDVGHMSDSEAREFWDWVKPKWLAHVTERRRKLKEPR